MNIRILLVIAGVVLDVAGQTSLEEKLAEQFYREGSFKRAHEIYAAIDPANLAPSQKRQVQFRAADSLWRSEKSTENPDTTKVEQALRALRELVKEDAPKDQIWAETQESLGDFHWTTPHHPNFGESWPHYEKALGYWAGSTNLAVAAERYLAIVWKAARPPMEREHYYGYYGNYLPTEVLENAIKIARTEDEKARAHFLLAMTLRNRGGEWEQRRRIPEAFEEAIKLKKDTDWYDDALYFYAEWMSNSGRPIRDEQGNWHFAPDYAKAVELFRRLTTEFRKGETRFYDQALNQIESITRPAVNPSVEHVFTPGAEIKYHLSWRNVKRIDLNLYRIDLTRHVTFRDGDRGSHEWLAQMNLQSAEKVKSWSKETGDKGDHRPMNETLTFEDKLEPGAYILEASAANASGREIILVNDVSLVLKTSGRQALVYFCDALGGAPIEAGNVTIWSRHYDGSRWRWIRNEGKTDKDGIFVLHVPASENQRELFVAATKEKRQAFSIGSGGGWHSSQREWKIYAFTDRPAYRPGETVKWKMVAREFDGANYSTPRGQKLWLRIADPRGAEINKQQIELNEFGSAWGELTLTSEMPLGAYNATFGRKQEETIGQAVLFRLEEYKLPEFKVGIQAPEENGRKKTFLLGEKVEVEIQADYYFGGPVANATVEVVVRQAPFYHYWSPPHEFEWFYEDARRMRHYRNPGQEIQRETLKTDASGKARLTIQTPANFGSDLEYQIEARVTDSSRREITGADSVRVTRQRYYVHARARHNLYKPQDKVEVEFNALDANQKPVVAEGIVKVTRDTWIEVWVSPDGREIRGRELEELRAAGSFPPLPEPDGRRWRLKFRGYEHDDILTRTLKTDTNGAALLSFTPEREGFYRIAWRSDEPAGLPIRTETTVWVASNTSTELGYRSGGLELIVDKDTFKAGETAPVMLTVPTADRYVLFTVEAEDLLSYQLVHVTGSVKLLQLDIEEKHVPNVRLGGALVTDYQLHMDTEEIVVPPTKNFLTMELEPDRAQYQPGEEGTFTLLLKNHEGTPVSAEVGLAVVDESVFYIQQDYAGDPRQFFFGQRRGHNVQTQSSFYQKAFARSRNEQDEARYKRESGDYDALSELEVAAAGRRDYFGGNMMKRAAQTRTLSASIAAPAAEMALGAKVMLADGAEPLALNAPAPGDEPAVQVRSDFRTSIFWEPSLKTDSSGKATVRLKYPDSLTGWKATARAATAGNQFGIAHAATRTKQPLIVRLQAPRFFLVGDTVTVSAVINNNTDQEMAVRTVIEIEGIEMPASARLSALKVAANGEARADWVLHPKKPGEAKIKILARGSEHDDAMEKSYPIYEHGIERFLATSGKVRGDDITVTLDLPRERKPGSTRMSIQVTPSLAVTMLDALPYLIDYPYGCTEQTMSRFLPAVITAKTLKVLGLHPEDVMSRAFGGIEPEHAAKTQPKGKKDLAKLDDLVKKGLQRLYDFQHSDGSWGWWKESSADHFMTAYVLWGMVLARQAGVDVREDTINSAAAWLDKEIVESERTYDLQAWILHALAAHHEWKNGRQMSEFQDKAFENLWENREKLNAYTRALFALAAHHFGKSDQARTLLRNLENGVQVDKNPAASILVKGSTGNEGQMAIAHWGNDGVFWRWSDGGVEATSFALRALMTIDPKHELVEPVTNWLIKNRRGAQWSNTRDTAITILALNDYLRQSGELNANMEYELSVNGRTIATRKISGADVFAAPSQFEIPAAAVRDGANEIRIVRKSGDSPIYFAAAAQFFSLEEPIPAAGNEIFVKREYYRLNAQPTLLKGFVYSKEKLPDASAVQSGDRIEVVLTVETKNNYEYLVFEDLKPAGFEAVEIRSGEPLYAHQLKSSAVEQKHGSGNGESGLEPEVQDEIGREGQTGNSCWVYQELRDRKVALFIDKLPQGVWEMRYEFRAEAPGEFHALPVLGHAMYVPEIRCNGSETRVRVADRESLVASAP